MFRLNILNDMSTYFQVLTCSFVIPFIFSFHHKIKFYKKWLAFIKANFLTLIPFLLWDEIFTKHQIWGFTNEHLMGIYIFSLPIEEVLFFIIIPYCCVFTYEVFKKFLLPPTRFVRLITICLAITTFILGILSYDKLYTSITFLSLGLLLFILFYFKAKFMSTFFLTYLVITLSFFIIVNGILTGGTLENPPVWYNNNHNLNVRIWTIPIEDFFYSMLLLLSNISLFEFFIDRKRKIVCDF